MTTESPEPSLQPPPRGLLLLVKSLGVVLLLLFVLLVAGIIWKATHKPAAVAEDVVFDLGIDPASIRLMALNGDRLSLTTDKEVLVVDVVKRKVLMRSSSHAQ